MEEKSIITNKALKLALLELISKKGGMDITVSELVKKAGVGRATFYRHYNSKEDIVKEINEDIVVELKKFFIASKKYDDLYEWYFFLFNSFENYSHILKMIFEIDSSINIFRQQSVFFFDNENRENIMECYQELVIEGAFLQVFKNWIFNGQKVSPKEMAMLCVKIMPSYTRSFILSNIEEVND